MENSVKLDKEIRIRKYLNYSAMDDLRKEITHKVEAEYSEQIKDYKSENVKLLTEEREFMLNARRFLLTCDKKTKLGIMTQVGPGGSVIQYYEGYLEKKMDRNLTAFNFCCPSERGGAPFTVGMSCLMSVEKI
jgi:hypothetical protein